MKEWTPNSRYGGHAFGFTGDAAKKLSQFDEFLAKVPQVVFVSATPGPWELRHSTRVAEQLIRPTGIVDPEIELRPTLNQIDDLLNEIRHREQQGERVLVTTLTKKMAEDLTDYLLEAGVKARYLHSEIDTLERIQIIRDLRLGEYDVLVGVNLLREGLDLPEVSLVAILDADKEGFLRSAWSLIQMIGRAARNVGGEVVMYADTVTESMRVAIDETNRRRGIQQRYNAEHGIVPTTIVKEIHDINDRLRAMGGGGSTDPDREARDRALAAFDKDQVEALVKVRLLAKRSTKMAHKKDSNVAALEEELADFVQLPRALYFYAGFATNVGVIPALVGLGDEIFADRLNHASLIDGALLSRARMQRYRHADLDHLAQMLQASEAKRKLIISDAVFSMDGDVAPLAELLALCERYDAMLVVDDAHGFGGEGVLRERDRAGRDPDRDERGGENSNKRKLRFV